MINHALEDRLKCRYYSEFMAENRTLYERDAVGYWRQASVYCSRKVREEVARLNDETKRK